MEQELIHLKTKASFHNGNSQDKSREIIDAFKNACLALDAGVFEPYMQEDDCFEDLDKYRFLNSLKATFDRVRRWTTGEIEVTMHNTFCRGCSYGKPVMAFCCYSDYGNRLIGKFGYLIDVENGILKDIYQCNGIILEESGMTEELVESILKKHRPEI